MSDIEEKEDDYDKTAVTGRNAHLPPTGEFDSHPSHQLQESNKNITKAIVMHDNTSSSSHFNSNTTTTNSSMLQNTKLSRNDYENVYYQKGKYH